MLELITKLFQKNKKRFYPEVKAFSVIFYELFRTMTGSQWMPVRGSFRILHH